MMVKPLKPLRYYQLACIALVMLAVTGCGLLNFGLNTRALTITVNLDETLLNRILTQAQESVATVNGTELLGEITEIDFQAPDTIRVFGTHNQNGNRLEGSFDLQTGLEQGALKASISAVNIPGITLESPVIQQINSALSSAFSEQISQQQEGAISSVTVTADALSLVIEVPFR
ncbi:MAG: hypothetical protein KF832_28140 [Caldilineaceae bacterium]|nr:hypothetical protein [Caldilineaceae bacterium]